VGGVPKRQQNKNKRGIFERHMGVMYVISNLVVGNIKRAQKEDVNISESEKKGKVKSGCTQTTKEDQEKKALCGR
jgi:hypothetical protein